MQFSIIVIDMDSGAYKAHYFEVKQCIFYYIYDISLSLVQDKKENKKKTRKKTKQVWLRAILHINPNKIVSTVIKKTSTN